MRTTAGILVAIFAFLPGAGAQPPVNPAADAHAGKAAQLLQDRRYGEAAAEFALAVAADPNNDAVRIQYATCLFIEENDEQSREQFEIERRRLGDLPGLTYYLGRLDLRANDFAQAIHRLQPLVANPAFPKASFYLGLAYLSAGQQRPALESLELAGKANPADPEVHYRLARVYTLAGRGADADGEYKIYRDARETQRLVEEEGHACMDALRAQPIADARLVCQKISDPKDARRMLLLGQLYTESGNFGDAVEPLRAAANLDPTSFDAWRLLGLSLYWLKNYPEALSPLQKAVDLNPQYFDTLNLLAATFHALGNDAAALPVLERAHALNPGDERLNAALERMRAEQRERH
jgi:tetratricopeptide (TPR) repeat protein